MAEREKVAARTSSGWVQFNKLWVKVTGLKRLAIMVLAAWKVFASGRVLAREGVGSYQSCPPKPRTGSSSALRHIIALPLVLISHATWGTLCISTLRRSHYFYLKKYFVP